jgi:uncharacterized hydrophobic protein (TIGR00271 family)
MQILEISPERFEVVHKEISDGSEPAMRFYILVAVSTLIASFGLISNSTAVVIGAMLVAPLMTPIFGISLALVRGEPHLLGRAARAEIVGVVAAVSMGFFLGTLLGNIEATPEMLSRTRPNLFDLIVAVLAGFAGAYALVDEKISPALPGVAIATAIVPPLANSGLCLALGEIHGGIGSFLLFFANFLSILIVASAVFVLSGMAKRYGAQAKKIVFARRFGLPFVAFLLIALFLGHSLIQIYEERRITKTVKTTLISETSRLPATYLGKVHHYSEADKIHVMANIHTPVMLTPTQVTIMQDQLTERIGKPTELIMHCVFSNNVSALGSVKNVVTLGLDGTFVKSSENETLKNVAIAEQIIREYFAADKSMDLIRVEPLTIAQSKIMLAHALGVRQLTPKEIGLLEARIRDATGEETVKLTFSIFQKTLQNTEGTIRYGWILGNKATPEIRNRIRKIRTELATAFNRDKTYDLVNVNATFLDGKLHFLLEIVGPEVYPRQNIEKLQAQLAQNYSEPIALYVWSRIEVVHGPEGPLSLAKLRQSFIDRQKENLPEEIPMILEASSR